MRITIFKIKSILVLLPLIFIWFLANCSGKGNVLPESQLKYTSPKKILELGAEKYSNELYEDAIYYYSNLIILYPEDNDINNESRAWATYEIGYIKYQQNDLNASLDYFEQTVRIKSQSSAPQLLAAQMIEKIENMKKKK